MSDGSEQQTVPFFRPDIRRGEIDEAVAAPVLTAGTRLGRRLLTQAVKLSPVNLRPGLGVKPDRDAKAIGLLTPAYTRPRAAAGDESPRRGGRRRPEPARPPPRGPELLFLPARYAGSSLPSGLMMMRNEVSRDEYAAFAGSTGRASSRWRNSLSPLRLFDRRGLGEVDDVHRRLVGGEEFLERLVQRLDKIGEDQRHRAFGVLDHRGGPPGATGPLGQGAFLALWIGGFCLGHSRWRSSAPANRISVRPTC